MSEYLKKEDYSEPCCPLDMHPETVRIPTSRVIEKLDKYLAANDYVSAENHLKYWLGEAENGHDLRGKLTVLNEQIGLYRKTDKSDEGIKAISSALALSEELGITATVSYATTLVNAATGYKAFGKADLALPLYQKARIIYEAELSENDRRLAGLYNNMALTVTELGNYREAEELFLRAISIMSKQEHGEAETAVTYLNLADLVTVEEGQEKGDEKITSYLVKAEELLNTEDLPRDANYAFICEKCAPAFGYYGYYFIEKELKERARMIYERS